MLTEHPGPRGYLRGALEAAPDIFEYSLRGLTGDEADFRPDPTRFSIREIVAHLADWDAIFLQRMQRTRDQDEPFLPDIDEGQLVIEHGYASAGVGERLQEFRQRRALLCRWVDEVANGEWQRACRHQRAGRLTLEGLATLIALHDAYHSRQIAQWRRAFAARAMKGK